ncbi:hypothetical protein [Streptosporangium sp. KLBMP 9127]|nr:hypothetical protein [Streptosporangium sp. KLBMP 9127]MCG5220782.1 hypothetical protein [Streptosporangium sp. KLBMP 9127]
MALSNPGAGVRVDVELHGTLTRARPIAWNAAGRVRRDTGLSIPDA